MNFVQLGCFEEEVLNFDVGESGRFYRRDDIFQLVLKDEQKFIRQGVRSGVENFRQRERKVCIRENGFRSIKFFRVTRFKKLEYRFKEREMVGEQEQQGKNVNYCLKACRVNGFVFIQCVLQSYWEVFKLGYVIVRFVFWKDNFGML